MLHFTLHINVDTHNHQSRIIKKGKQTILPHLRINICYCEVLSPIRSKIMTLVSALYIESRVYLSISQMLSIKINKECVNG